MVLSLEDKCFAISPVPSTVHQDAAQMPNIAGGGRATTCIKGSFSTFNILS